MPQTSIHNSPEALVAIARAARAAGDRDLERSARRQLADNYGIELTFRRAPVLPAQEVPR